MRIDLLPTNLALQPEHKSYIVRRVGAALLRMAARIRHVEVRLADVNGPRGGLDKRCRLLMHVDGSTPLLVEEQGGDLRTLIDNAVARAGRIAAKHIGRSTGRRHGARSHRQFAL